MSNRILYVADGVSWQSKVGDLVHVKEFVQLLCKKGFQVTLLVRSSRVSQRLERKNLNIFKIPSFIFPWSVFCYIASFMAITIAVLMKKPNLIYVRDSGINIGVIIAKLLRIPVFLEINGDLAKEYSELNRIPQIFGFSLMKATYVSADRIIIPSQNQKLLLLPLGITPEKISNVANGVNPSLFRPLDKNLCRTKLSLPDAFHFCFVGHLTEWQGIDKAIVAFSELIREDPNTNARLMIVGDGPLRSYLESLVLKLRTKSNITFFGSIPYEQVPNVINACDVCIAPFTEWRNKKIGVSALKLFEYLSCGKPVIASVVPGTEIIRELDAGILVKPDSIEDLRIAYEKAIGMSSYWEKKACVLHEEIAKKHSWDSRVDDIVKIMYSSNDISKLVSHEPESSSS